MAREFLKVFLLRVSVCTLYWKPERSDLPASYDGAGILVNDRLVVPGDVELGMGWIINIQPFIPVLWPRSSCCLQLFLCWLLRWGRVREQRLARIPLPGRNVLLVVGVVDGGLWLAEIGELLLLKFEGLDLALNILVVVAATTSGRHIVCVVCLDGLVGDGLELGSKLHLLLTKVFKERNIQGTAIVLDMVEETAQFGEGALVTSWTLEILRLRVALRQVNTAFVVSWGERSLTW